MKLLLRRVLVSAFLLILGITVSLVLTEVGIRILRPQKGFAVTVNTWDRILGTRHVPGARGFVTNQDYSIDLIINSKGLRDREFAYAKPEGTRRILCLGGSFTCGYGVQAEETFSKALERLLNAGKGDNGKWEVLNAGVGSTGTAHQLAYFTTEGHKYQPDFVLLCFSQGTDHWDNITSGLYTLEDEELVKHDATTTSSRKIQQITRWIPGYNTLFAKSHLLNFIKIRVARFHFRDLAENLTRQDTVTAQEKQEQELTRALILALRDACDRIDCRLVMTGIPDVRRGYSYREDTIELIEFTESHGIPFAGLSEPLRDAEASGVKTTFEHDLHWSRNGHRTVGRALSEFFSTVD